MSNRKPVKTIGAFMGSTKELISSFNTSANIPDIITFCESPDYLNLTQLSNPVHLYPVQKIILKTFYLGTIGNENIELTKEEEQLCHDLGMTDKKNGDILNKIKLAKENGTVFRELVLVWGRRASKDFIVSILALYEAMKLLQTPGGDPYATYRLGSANPFTILTIANSSSQALLLYNEIREKIRFSPYFQGKYKAEGFLSDSIALLTPKDKRDNEEFIKKGMPIKMGSVVIQAGHSNSDSLLGKSCFVLMLDEVASYKQSGGSSSGDRLYNSLAPTTATYVRKVKEINEFGEEVERRIYDGKMIAISSPRGQDGIFYQLYNKSHNISQRLMCKLPTWKVNPTQSESALRTEFSQMDDAQFNMEFGAEFSGLAGENFFVAENVEACFRNNYHFRDLGAPGVTYFAHLDPAVSSHNYALAVVHKETFLNNMTHRLDFNIIVDHLRVWSPKVDKESGQTKTINFDEIDSYLLYLNRRFHLGLVTYDNWRSPQSINKMRQAGIPCKMTAFTNRYTNEIYDNLVELINTGKLKIPMSCDINIDPGLKIHQEMGYAARLLRNEMLNLQRRFTSSGYRIYPKSEGDCKTDDLADSVAGAVANVMKSAAIRLPMSGLVNMGSPSQSNSQVWRGMQGQIIGQGSAGRVVKDIDSRFRNIKYPW